MNNQSGFWGICFLLLIAGTARAQHQYSLHYFFVDKDTAFQSESLKLQKSFTSKQACSQYISGIPTLLKLQGYITASVDSMQIDSLAATVWVFTGQPYRWVGLETDSADIKMLNAIGWNNRNFSNGLLDLNQMQYWQEKMLDYYENNGHPFAKVVLDSFIMDDGKVSARLITRKGPAYKIDSIRVYGKAKISTNFLQRYLGIEDGSLYRKSKLEAISQRLRELPYLQEVRPWDITMTGAGSVLNVYVDPKKSSQADVLIGFLPATNEVGRTKMQLTGEANINLKNSLGSGETIGVNWQQIQVKSPRLHLKYEQPFIFKSAFGIDFNFDLLKKDSSYLNLTTQFGVQYLSSGRQSGKVFVQSFVSNVLPAGIDTAIIKTSKRLPAYIDMSTTNLGINYNFNSTDYRFNPGKGNELSITAAAGIRKVKPNNAITKMTTDASGNEFDYAALYDSVRGKSYMLRLQLAGAHYFKTGRQSVIKTALNSGMLYSQNIFLNEMFQIGGYKLLRGFDEESIFASSYGVVTAEYRYFIGLNSFFFGFVDGGLVNAKTYSQSGGAKNLFGMGLGMAFETKAGIFNLSYAVGKRENIPLNFRQAKIHFGMVSLF